MVIEIYCAAGSVQPQGGIYFFEQVLILLPKYAYHGIVVVRTTPIPEARNGAQMGSDAVVETAVFIKLTFGPLAAQGDHVPPICDTSLCPGGFSHGSE